ncbi:accessory factor UbiK family protein [Acinetobacter sp. MD2]|uniref:accessory factor UbiK family protein n=1 Tax=Acinetobacter sp. MD2 TaxID=2600066 RepID=UPI002D1F6422|nr:accessory factor UbiK family protein [Acinetobacter sp. MD2]MEB3766920.1 accessory factor UbiK family protein [Acinetobacter sp. MD2]
MLESLLQAILAQVEQPKKDLEHNLRALLNETIERMDLVSQSEIDRQKKALETANLRLTQLKQQVDQLEQALLQLKKAP